MGKKHDPRNFRKPTNLIRDNRVDSLVRLPAQRYKDDRLEAAKHHLQIDLQEL